MSTTMDRIKAEADAADEALRAFANPTPADPAVNSDPAANDPGIPSAPAPVAAAPAAPAAQPIDADVLAQVQHRLASLEGMYNGVVSERDQLRGKVDTLTQLVAKPAAPAAPAAAPLVTEKDREDYGEDFLDLARRIAQQTLGPAVQQILSRLERLEASSRDISGKVEMAHEVASQTVQHTFEDKLTKLVPDWEALNTNKQFLDYLRKADIFSGTERYALLQQALGDGNAERVASFFTAFKSESGLGDPAPVGAKTPPPTPSVDPRAHIAPGSSAPAPASTNSQHGKVWTSDEIAKVYDDKMKGRTPPAEFARLEAMIFKAVEEGRVAD